MNASLDGVFYEIFWCLLLPAHFLGAAVLGTTFDWTDFPWYFIGSGIGWFSLSRLRRS